MGKSVSKTLSVWPFLLGLVTLLAISLISTVVLAERPAAAIQTPEPTYDYRVYAPLISKPAPPTPTPTPTPTPIPVNVSGTYWVVNSNLVENCDGDWNLPPDQDAEVVQDGTNLTITFRSGTTTGTIQPFTGAFRVEQAVTPTPGLCPYGCNRTTEGAFNLTATPLVFNAHTVFEVLTQQGTIYCTYAFDQTGTRK